MTRMTIIVAIRPGASSSSRLEASRKPSDFSLAMITSSSPAIRLRQEKAQPCLSPADEATAARREG